MSAPFDGPEPFYRSCGGGEPDYDGDPSGAELATRHALVTSGYWAPTTDFLMALAAGGYAVVPFAQHANAVQALRFIAGPSDSGALIEVYRDAGGGYEGLQAVARHALGDEEGA